MPSHLRLAPVGAGKTEIALNHLAATLQEQAALGQPFARVWVLVAGERQESAFRQRLVDRGGHRAYFNLEFFNFYSLYSHILNLAGWPQRRLNDAARYRLLRNILVEQQRAGQLRLFGQIAHLPGFVRAVADFVDELKQNIVSPDQFAASAISRKDYELAQIYAAYMESLRSQDLVDQAGEGWLALEVLRERPAGFDLQLMLLLVDGFDQFSSVQARLLARLSAYSHDTLLTLTTVPGREDTIGRRFRRARETLEAAFEREGQPLVVEVAAAPPGVLENRHPTLRRLAQDIFRGDEVEEPAGDGLVLMEAPTPAQESEGVLRRVKRLLLTGSAPDDVLIALRDWAMYRPHFSRLARTYELPMALHYGEPLAENPAITALINLLDLHSADFPRRDLLDTLRSPYFAVPGLTSSQADLLERVSRVRRIIGGRAAWLAGIRAASETLLGDEDEALENREVLLQPHESVLLMAALPAFFDKVTPPTEASVPEYVRWLEGLIGPESEDDPDEGEERESAIYHLHMLSQLRQISTSSGAAGWVVARDLAAMHQFKLLLRGMLTAQELLANVGDSRLIRWAEFIADLKAAVNSATAIRSPNRTGRVLVTTVENARGLPHRHVFILGLSEGLFPAQLPEDPLYLDSERTQLAEAGIPLRTQAERADDEGLFYELLSLARDSLTLSRPTVQNGIPWIESHLWRAVTALFSDSDEIIRRYRIPIGVVVTPEDAASPDEVALAVAAGLSSRQVNEPLAQLHDWLLMARRDYWTHIRLGRQIERSRMSRRWVSGHERYNGYLKAPVVRDWVTHYLGAEHVWSASQLNDYAKCGFRFYAARLMRLSVLEQPEDRMDAAQLGTLNHAILEQTYRQIGDEQLAISEDNVERAVAILNVHADAVLRDAPQRWGFRASPLWEQEREILRRRLENLVRLDFSRESPVARAFGAGSRYPYSLETSFSSADGAERTLELPFDVGGVPDSLRITGVIDRIDSVDGKMVIVDYKSGSTEIPVSDMEGGYNFQMMLYLLAAHEILKADPDAPGSLTGGLFWHIRSRVSSGEIHLEDSGMAAIASAREHLGHYVAQARDSHFPMQPTRMDKDRCFAHCEFHRLCRVTLAHRGAMGD